MIRYNADVMKTCSKCGEEKPTTSFRKEPGMVGAAVALTLRGTE